MDAVKPPVQCGDILAGKYRVEALLGKGGMGFVVAARHIHLEQRVAIKFMRPEALEAEGARARFERESRAAVRLRSEHVARVLDVGLLENDSPYIVMEYLEGSNLRAVLKQRVRLGCDEAATYIMQACEAVAEAHALGMVHRDIKPTNLFLTYTPTGRPCVKVLDFGIVKTLEGPKSDDGLDEATLTKTQAALGSPRYMAPEQVASAKKVDRRSDVWALGACLYQFVTGKPAFQAENLLELGAKIVHEDPPDPKGLRTDLPDALAQIILCCLEKSPERRFADARQLGMALEQYLAPPASNPDPRTSSPIEIPARPSARVMSSPSSTQPISSRPNPSPIDPFVPLASEPVVPPRVEDTSPTDASKQNRTNTSWEGSGTGATAEHKRPGSKMPLVFALLTLFAFVGVGLGAMAIWARHSRATQAQAATAPPPASTLPPPTENGEGSPRPADPKTAEGTPPQPTASPAPPEPPPTETAAVATTTTSPAKESAPTPAPPPQPRPAVTVRREKPITAPAQPKPASSRAFDHL